MRSRPNAALLVALSLALVACQQKRPEPVPGPQSHGTAPSATPARHPHDRLFRF
jgi:hypothetical protein